MEIDHVVISDHWIRLLPKRAGFMGPSKLTIHVDGIEIDVAVNAEKDRYVVRAIRGNDLTGEKLRGLRLAEIVGEALEDKVVDGESGLPAPADLLELVEDFSELREDKRVVIVSLLYAFAYITGQRPTAYVTQKLGIPRSTASRLIKKGRMAERWLGPTTERKAGI